MKKIIVCLVIALTAIVTQAASATWGIMAISTPSQITDLSSMTAYLVQETSTFKQSDLVSGLKENGVSALEGHYDVSKALTPNASGVASLVNVKVSSDAWVSGGTYDFYTVIIATDTSNNSYYLLSNKMITGVGVNTSDALTKSLAFGSQAENTAWAPTPAGTNIPEPTSGLLLLVGGALLALRRKQK